MMDPVVWYPAVAVGILLGLRGVFGYSVKRLVQREADRLLRETLRLMCFTQRELDTSMQRDR